MSTIRKFALGALAASISMGVMADEAKKADDQKIDGIQYSLPVGPMYDPDFDFALAAIPTALYQFDEESRPSYTKLTVVYGSTDNKNVGLETDNYFLNDKVRFWNYFGYTDATMTMQDILELQGLQDASLISKTDFGSLSYQVIDDLFLGVSWNYSESTVQRSSGTHEAHAVNLPDNTVKQYGLVLNYDKRDNTFMPTKGMYLEANFWKTSHESTGSEEKYFVKPHGLWMDNQAVKGTVNNDYKYKTLKLESRFYQPISEATTVAYRAKALYNTDKAPTHAVDLSQVAQGFSREVVGRSVVAAETQLRHWLNNDWGLVGGVAVGKAFNPNDKDKDGLYIAGTLGLRYMLVPESKLALRIDLTQSNQKEEKTLLYFRVGEAF